MALDTAKAEVILRDLTVKFDNAVAAATPFYPQVCTTVDSTGRDEKYAMLGNMPGVREWIGDREVKQLRAADFTLENKHWESTLGISKRDIRDDRMGLYGPLLEQLAAEATYHPDELLFNLLDNGGSTLCFDGQNFYDTDHVWGDSGTQSNIVAESITTANAPTGDEFKKSFHAARTRMMSLKNDQGKYMNRSVFAKMSNFMAIVPPNMELAAREALQAALVGGGNSNIVIDVPEIVTSPLLTSDTSWHLLNLAAPLKPFVFQNRQPLVRQIKGLEDHYVKDVAFLTEAEYEVGVLAWYTAARVDFS